MTVPPTPGADRVAVIGAGVAGIACARRLKDRGCHPVVFEKSRGLGGRLATRRLPDGVGFDHGAQYVTARGAGFGGFIRDAITAGVVERWSPAGGVDAVQGSDPWYVGTPTMSALVRPAADGIEIRLSTEIVGIARQGQDWRVKTASGPETEPFRAVVVTTPAPQASRLVAAVPRLAQSLAGVSMAPCWALMVQLAGPVDPGFDVLRSPNDTLAWVVRNDSKPGRTGPWQTWVAHAGVEWTRQHLEEDRDVVAGHLLDALLPLIGGSRLEIRYAGAHRWRYARTLQPLGAPFMASDDGSLIVAGDWCLGARVECAFDSGSAAADAVTPG